MTILPSLIKSNFLVSFDGAELQKVNSYIGAVHELSGILSSDFSKALSSVHKSCTELQGLGRTMQVLWKLMETPTDERRRFDKLSSLLSVQADDALGKGCLGLDIKMLIWVKVSCISADASKVYFTAGMKKRSIDAYEVIKPY
ncbi:hypothetical protein F2Q70_00028555 [Brassica cretica]|uniref:Uncharacterized protein n=1 Tax=Brassica cretica TaxID=69181 RepID=A0A8S9LC26_BRACR|nr:hypothetical protein F2Q68_00028111 [Brassica cretica]KAF2605700.1 hypothetical protein F2Q70_00028555 [Brassica cretica]